MKKVVLTVIAAILASVLCFAIVGCGGSANVKVIEIDLSHEEYGVAIKKGDTAMKETVDAIIKKITGEGVEVDGKNVTFNSLYEAEMTALDENDAISIGEVKKTSSDRSKELVVATNADFAPFEYFVGESFGGIDMQIAKILAKEMGKELVVLHSSFETVLDNVKSGKADIALAGLTINADRLVDVDFSTAYYVTTQRIAVVADNNTFDSCKTEEEVVAAMKTLKNVKAGAAKTQTGYYYLTGNESFEFEGFPNLEVKQYNSISAAVQDLANGTIGLVCGDKDVIAAAVKGINR